MDPFSLFLHLTISLPCVFCLSDLVLCPKVCLFHISSVLNHARASTCGCCVCGVCVGVVVWWWWCGVVVWWRGAGVVLVWCRCGAVVVVWWCGGGGVVRTWSLICVFVHTYQQLAPNYGSRVPVDTAPGPVPCTGSQKDYPSYSWISSLHEHSDVHHRR